MVTFSVFIDAGSITGFELKGHANTAEHGKDIVCAAVSSAAYLTVNTLTEEFGIAAQCEVSDGYMRLSVTGDSPSVQPMLKGLVSHIREISCDYPHNLKVIFRR